MGEGLSSRQSCGFVTAMTLGNVISVHLRFTQLRLFLKSVADGAATRSQGGSGASEHL